MVKVTKKKMGKLQVTIREYFPDDPKDMDTIKDTLTEFTINQFRKMYPEEVLEVAIPAYQNVKKLQETGLTFEESKKQVIKKLNTQSA